MAEDLGPGSAAPKLDVVKWFKGTPIEGFDPGKIYVIEFWATWCGPCRETIPHLTDLAKKNPDVTFIGVSAFEDDKDDNIKKFVEQMGEKMDYNVAYTGNRDRMAQTWMIAANQDGIPTSFVVKDGTIQWIGHPMGLEKPLGELKAGNYDLAAFKAKFDKNMVAVKESNASSKAFTECVEMFKAGKRAEAKKQLDEVVKKYPKLTSSADTQRFYWLAEEDPKAWEKKAKEYADSKNGDKIQKLVSFAIRQAEDKGEMFKLGKKALDLAEKATESKDYRVLQYAVTFYSGAKDAKNELVYVRKIILVFPTSQYKDQPDVLKYWQDRAKELEAKIKG